VQCVIKADKYKKIRFCAVQSKAAEPYLIACGLDRKDVLRRFLFVEGPGSCHQASTGVCSLYKHCYHPFPRPNERNVVVFH
jgi:predicted DCC family thiol-disulfide oxidoreductase YuxK